MTANLDLKPATPDFGIPDGDANQSPPPSYKRPKAEGTSLDVKYPISKDKHVDVDVDVRSVNSSASTLADFSSLLLPNIPFTPGRSFHVAARGIGAIRLPIPSSELEIDIYNADGSVAYTSNRARRSKGDAVLASPEKGDLVSTSYSFGPNKQPIIKTVNGASNLFNTEFEETGKNEGVFQIQSKWTSRSITMTHRESGRTFEWSYDSIKTHDDKGSRKANLLVLRLKDHTTPSEFTEKEKGSDGQGKVLAQLIRSKETRTPGSKSCSAGNGGQLVLADEATTYMDEPLIVATCLMMLKKEIDRRRAVQFAVLVGVASGGI